MNELTEVEKQELIDYFTSQPEFDAASEEITVTSNGDVYVHPRGHLSGSYFKGHGDMLLDKVRRSRNATPTATGPRLSFPIYEVSLDEFSGSLGYSYRFDQPVTVEHVRDKTTGLIVSDVLNEGPHGTITAPAGSKLGTTEAGNLGLFVPEVGYLLDADSAYRLARDGHFGLHWGPGQKGA